MDYMYKVMKGAIELSQQKRAEPWERFKTWIGGKLMRLGIVESISQQHPRSPQKINFRKFF